MSHDNMNVQENLGNQMSDQILVLYCIVLQEHTNIRKNKKSAY